MNAVQCDYCGRFAPNPNARRYSIGHRALPDDWFVAGAWMGGNTEGQQASETDHGEFCSRECIAAHFAEPVPA